MKLLFNHPLLVFVAATLACLCIMIIVDYMLGSEAEFLNAWAIINKLINPYLIINDSWVVEKTGLFGAVGIMLATNAILGVLLINIIKFTIKIIYLL